MKVTYEQHMKGYRNKRKDLLKMLRDSRVAKRAAMRQKKVQLVQRKKSKSMKYVKQNILIFRIYFSNHYHLQQMLS